MLYVKNKTKALLFYLKCFRDLFRNFLDNMFTLGIYIFALFEFYIIYVIFLCFARISNVEMEYLDSILERQNDLDA